MDLVGFAALSAVIVLVPGPAVTLVMKSSMLRGRTAALQTAAGVFVADLFWMVASVVGLTAVLVASRPVFQTIRLLGALYLCWLGLGLLLARRRDGDPTDPAIARGSMNRTGAARLFRGMRLTPFVEGALCDLSNPKTMLVFTSVIPQFLPATGGAAHQVALLGLAFAVIGFGSLLLYTLIFGGIGLAGVHSRVGDALLRLGGAILVVFGVRLALDPLD